VFRLIISALQTPAPTRLVPVGLAGSLAVKLVGNSMLVGRLPCCRVEIPLPTVSSHHCRLARVGSRWYIEDLGSRNGTFVNGSRIRKKRLHIGDKISIGDFALRVE
jgi:pSer/pThr/pTyr-binding forkhead associated (FHA) protein